MGETGKSDNNKYWEYEGLKKSPNPELVSECLKDNRAAWEEFFHRFTPHIITSIKNVLKTTTSHLLYTEQAFDQCSDRIIDKLMQKSTLERCGDPFSIRNWPELIKTISENETKNWLRSRKCLKNLPKLPIEAPAVSLDQPFGNDTDSTYLDIIASPQETTDVFQEFITSSISALPYPSPPPPLHQLLLQRSDKVLEAISTIKNKKQRWALRLECIAVAPLSDEEILELADFNGLSPDAILQILAAVIKSLEGKMAKQDADHTIALRYWHKMRNLEATLYDQFHRPDVVREAELLEELDDISSRYQEKQKASQCLASPSRAEIAALLGLPQQATPDISSNIARGKSKVESMMKKEKKLNCL